ncbi:MAG TPA: hypothetical protein VGJ21_17395 [Terracidiphilus sp.]|jgi:hypothetical protein
MSRLRLALSSNWVGLGICFCFCFFLSCAFAFVVVFGFCFSCCHLQFAGRLRLDSDGPDEAEQFASHSGSDLALVLAGCRLYRCPIRVFLANGDTFNLATLRMISRRGVCSAECRAKTKWPEPCWAVPAILLMGDLISRF